MKDEELLDLAERARQNAYAPYSGYSVGAALLAQDGSVTSGCNVENASYGGTICAERTALVRAIAEGKRSFCAIAIVGGRQGEAAKEPFMPCGICRQMLREFCTEDFRVLVRGEEGTVVRTLAELIPEGFTARTMQS